MRDEATKRQVDAANPRANTWLSANAGSGKTRVLTDRVARLLLDGANPQRILCLTYTKAAASEMQNRLFKRLGAWAMLDEPALKKSLSALGVEGTPDLAQARRLFARAIETPGGLKIQTIHAFCASVLRRFPMEAGVSPDFSEMEDRAARLLRDEVVDEMASGPDAGRVADLAAHYSGAEFDTLLGEITRARDHFAQAVTRDEVFGWLGLPTGFTVERALAALLSPDAIASLRAAIPVLARHSTTMQALSAKLAAMELDTPGPQTFDQLCDAFLTKAGTPRKNLVTKPARADFADNGAALDDLAAATEAALDQVKALRTAERSLALHAFARPFVTAYESQKAARGWLDFDDLIVRTASLLATSQAAQWVLYRLDGGIDHILVDEAQDTSPAQWQVIRRLAEEFTAGEGAHSGRDWSLFVVGDPKQSIYSFQGADPEEFAHVRDLFGARLDDIGRPLQRLPLEYSFRSAPAILTAVDAVLENQSGLGDTKPLHRAFHATRPGRVDLWPAVDKAQDPEPRDWHDPVDLPSPEDHAVRLADAVAQEVARMLEEEQLPDGDGFRPITAGDVLILVQRRSDLFHHIIRACKSRGLPIAGADRLRIGGEMAVKDLTALLAFLATPEDDLSLAAVLRSPLFGWSEDDLFRLAHGRAGYLWAALRTGDFPGDLAVLEDLRDQADFLRPYDLIDRVLTRHDGRRLLIGRLGAEAEDGIDAMLAQALAYERMDVPSLTGFLTWLETEDVEIKRQMEAEASEIRVMTVHGSKGLESPIVIMPDTAKRDLRARGEVILGGPGPVWRPSADAAPSVIRDLGDAAKDRDRDERMRLLYVAMTRAESWLIVAAAGDVGKDGASWHGLVADGLGRLGATALETPTGAGGLRYQTGTWAATTPREVEHGAERDPSPPAWAETPAPTPERVPAPLAPSDLGGGKVVAGDQGEGDSDAAKRRGRQIHRLLEFLPAYPQAAWRDHATALLAFGEDAAEPDELADVLGEVETVLTADHLAPLFGPDSLAEVEISAPTDVAGATRIHGIIDLLVVSPDRVLAVDFKSNRVAPRSAEEIPEGILRQLGAYEVALAPLYPGREIASAVLWTRSARLMDLPPGLALGTFSRLDANGADT